MITTTHMTLEEVKTELADLKEKFRKEQGHYPYPPSMKVSTVKIRDRIVFLESLRNDLIRHEERKTKDD